MKTIPTLTWYLEMFQKPEMKAAMREGFTIRQWEPSMSEYLAIYRAVGDKYNWCDRILMPEDNLKKVLESRQTEILLLEKYGKQAGFAELDHSVEDQIELVYFGLTDEFTGQGAGYPFLMKVIENAWNPEYNVRAEWKYPVKRVWLHTCSLDHPAALPMYQKAGFVVYKTETIMQQTM